MQPLFYLILRELRLELSQISDILVPIMFFLLSSSLMLYLIDLSPLAKMQNSYLLLLLAGLLPLQSLYQQDLAQGFLEILHDAKIPLLFYAYSKSLALCLLQIMGLLPAMLIYSIIANLQMQWLISYLFGGVLVVAGSAFLGSMMAGLVANFQARAGFVALLLLPLILPWLIFASVALQYRYFGLSVQTHFLLLGGLTLLAGVICPLITAKILQISQQRW